MTDRRTNQMKIKQGGHESALKSYLFFISFIFIDVNVYRFKYEKQIVIEQIIYYVRLYKKKTQKVKV